MELARSGERLRHRSRVAAGFGSASSRHLLGRHPAFGDWRLLDPTLQALRAIPSIAWVPLFILWLGIFEASKVR